ncbi:MAG: seg [Microgenomates group bacterium GW2011_GWC1_44_10]|nr:MAG: seg [Microgenomates group bacterium GW2011_GWC1_44_10]
MKLLRKNYWEVLIVSILIIAGLFFRLKGISSNHSFWNDESHVAIMARGVLEYGRPITPAGYSTGIYQIILYYITALSFKIFGISEFTGRLPSVLAGAGLVITGYFIAKKLFSLRTATIVAFLLTFSQIQLAWSTQLRPYIWLELFTLLISYFLYQYIKSPWKLLDKYFIYSVTVSLLSCLFHGTGILNLAIVGLIFMYKIIKYKKYVYISVLPLLIITGVWVVYRSMGGGWGFVHHVIFKIYFSPLHYRIFLTHNYLWLIFGASIGFFTLYRRNKELAVLLGGSVVFIFAIAIFKINPRYVRYSLPAFPLMYLLFAEGVVSVIDKVTKRECLRWLLVILTVALLSLTGKFVFWPKYYYSINADMRENPIVDYKFAFAKIQNLIKDKKDVIVMDAWNDRVPWYLPGQKYIFLFKDGAGKIDPVFGEKILGTIKEFEAEKKLYESGIVIVEDWESLMNEDIKEYVRKNLKFEFTVQDLPYNENDHWGISVYSWGI